MICAMKSSLKIVGKTKITFLLSETLLFFLEQKYIFFLETYFLRFLRINYLSIFFLSRQILKKHRFASVKASNASLVKLTDWIIKNDHVISCAMFFCKWFKHGQTGNVIWLSTTWLDISRLEVTNKKPLFTTKPASIWTEISYQKDITFYSYKILYTGKMLFLNVSKIKRN